MMHIQSINEIMKQGGSQPLNIATDYMHALEGRIRVKVPEIKGSPAKAGELERQVQWQSGIHSIKANPTTGNVLIYYDSQKTEQEKILNIMKEFGYLQPLTANVFQSPELPEQKNSLMGLVVSSVAQSVMEMALTRLVTAII
jgi:Heavy metal associated domain 2